MLQTVSRPLGGQRVRSACPPCSASAGTMALRGPPTEDRAQGTHWHRQTLVVVPGTASRGGLDSHQTSTTPTPASSTRPWRGRKTSPAGGNKESSSRCGIPSSRRASGMVQHSNPLRTFRASHGSMGSSNRQIGVYTAKYIQMTMAAQPPKRSLSRFHWGLTPTGQVEGKHQENTKKTPRQHQDNITMDSSSKLTNSSTLTLTTSTASPSRPSGSQAYIFASFYSSSSFGGWQFPQPYPQPDHLSQLQKKRQNGSIAKKLLGILSSSQTPFHAAEIPNAKSSPDPPTPMPQNTVFFSSSSPVLCSFCPRFRRATRQSWPAARQDRSTAY